MRVGIGYDIHKLVLGRPLVVGGIRISFDKGLDGHSDADVLLHAVSDAILGALAEGDIGTHFPDTDPAYKNADSAILFGKVAEMMKKKGFSVENLDCVIIAEAPKFSEYRDRMRTVIADILCVSVDSVSIKSKTNEGLGSLGANEAIAAQAMVLLREENHD